MPEKDQSDFGFCSKVDVPENDSTGHCRADSDPHIRQFDGNTFDVMGTCLYTLVQPRDPRTDTGADQDRKKFKTDSEQDRKRLNQRLVDP